MKTTIADTSSIIILFKSDLIERFVVTYRVIITGAVYDELAREGYPGAEMIQQYRASRKIIIQEPPDKSRKISKTLADKPVLGRGEEDMIRYFLSGVGDFVTTDDGKCVSYCKKKGIPHINALLFPKILFAVGAIEDFDYEEKSKAVLDNGRYSDEVIDFARNCSLQDLGQFLPFRHAY
jgi:hypothetical protein